jgi:hypothetical protein
LILYSTTKFDFEWQYPVGLAGLKEFPSSISPQRFEAITSLVLR